MRDLEFRAWTGESMVNNIDFKVIININSPHHQTIESLALAFDWDSLKWMQYTGLKDSEGTKVFEGDIIEYWHDYDGIYTDEKNTVEIFFGLNIGYGSAQGFHAKKMNGEEFEFYGGTPLDFEGYKTKVIGNIYQNPELIAPHP